MQACPGTGLRLKNCEPHLENDPNAPYIIALEIATGFDDPGSRYWNK